jgi:hypothetical protein
LESEERKSELQRHRVILLATIDYIIEKIASENLTSDDFEVIAGYYRRQKQQVEKHFELGRLYNLQQQLNKLTEFPTRGCDLTFNEYIKKKTGYNIDIFDNLRIRVKEIIMQNQIKNKKQFNDIVIILNVYKQQSVDQEKLDILKNLLSNYFDKKITT